MRTAVVHATVELVESVPLETALDHADIADTHTLWLEMIGAARRTLVLSHFYASNAPGTRLDQVIEALEAAAARGVRVELLVDAAFAQKYPDTLTRLSQGAGIEVRALNLVTGGVQHAKYMVADDREAWLGSANLDWRALTHIHEIGVRIRASRIARALGTLHAQEWAWAAGARPHAEAPPAEVEWPAPPEAALGWIELVASPNRDLPAGVRWDLPRIVALIDGALRTVHVQVLSYSTVDRLGSDFRVLDDALRRAAARGVAVDLVVSDWSLGEPKVGALSALARVPGVSVRVARVPAFSGGFIPYARVAHAKYTVVDGARAWIGTSNWEGVYFLRSRNVGILLDDAAIATGLERVFADVGRYCEPLDAALRRAPARIAQ